MLRNHFKIAWRNLWKNRGFSFLNIFGLAIGIACAGLIFLWVEDVVNFNDYFANKENIYKVKNYQTYDGTTYTFDATPGPLSAGIKNDIPGIRQTARISWDVKKLFSVDDKNLYASGSYVDPEFFSIFKLNFLKGSEKTAFNQLHSVVLTEGLAIKTFGTINDILGKTLKLDNDQEYVVSGVIENLPTNISINFEWLSPFEVFKGENFWLQYWASNGITTYVELDSNANLDSLNKQLYDYIGSKQEGATSKIGLYPMTRWALYDTFENGKEIPGMIKYVKLFSLIAWIILIIACINFMNLSTARSQKRAREVGVRKVLGAGKNGLIFQFIGESMITALFSSLLAVGFMFLALPFFNLLVEKELSIQLFNPVHLGVLLGIAVSCGLIAGLLPAFYLSSFKPVKVLKGLRIKEGSAVWVRQSLVVVQFSVSIILIIGTTLIYQQIQHVKERNLGFNKDHLIYLGTNDNMRKNFDVLQNELVKSGYVESIALSTNSPLSKGSNSGNFSWNGKDPNKDVLISFEGVTPDYTSTMGMKINDGRNFYPNIKIDSASVLINQAFADVIGNKDIVGSTINFQDQTFNVIGVLKDFVFNNIYGKSDPILFYPKDDGNYLNIRLKSNTDVAKSLSSIKEVFAKYNPGYPFEYKFADEQFEKYFKTETLIGELAGVFAALAILISCLGLFGLAAYTAEQRTKEIGVRKVLGASVQNLMGLLSKDFLKLVIISCVIAFPLAWWVMKNWLQDYEYRISIGWWVFAIAGLSAVLIALLTVSFQAIKAAVANPVKSLRTE